jgi:hypothetical protein
MVWMRELKANTIRLHYIGHRTGDMWSHLGVEQTGVLDITRTLSTSSTYFTCYSVLIIETRSTKYVLAILMSR